MSTHVVPHDWPAIPWESDVPLDEDVGGLRGLLYSVAISLVFVWAPIGFIIFGTTLLAGR